MKLKQIEYYTVGWFGKDDTIPTKVSESDFMACVDDGGIISHKVKWANDPKNSITMLTATVPHDVSDKQLDPKTIEIEMRDDTYDCELCGTDWAEAGTVKIDGNVVLDIAPHAHCFDGVNYTEAELLVMALKKIGTTVLVEGNPFHVTRHNDDYHGPIE